MTHAQTGQHAAGAHHIINFYQFHAFSADELAELKASWTAAAESRALLGTILLAPEGINAGLCGAAAKLEEFVAWVKRDPRFDSVEAKWTQGRTVPFRHLEVKIKRWIIRFAESDDPAVPAILAGERTTPTELHALLANRPEDVIVVDTRNDYEYEHGAFAGAVRLPIKNFTEFPKAFTDLFPDAGDKQFLFYCTGGVRCEKVVPWARERGYRASQLDGGILRYFQEFGGSGYEGSCFVFDERRLVDPNLLEPADTSAARYAGANPSFGNLSSFRPARG